MNRNVRFEPLVGKTLSDLGERKSRPVEAIPTPFPSWNEVCGEEGGAVGLARGWVITVGGVTGAGKSYLALNLAANGVLEGKKVGNVNFEMSKMQVATRYVSILTGMKKWKMEMGKHFDRGYWDKACSRVNDIYDKTGGMLISNDSSVFSLKDIEASYEQLVDEGCTMIIVDYAQLVSVDGAGGIFQRSEAVASKLRDLTHYHDVITIPVSQFNREEAKKESQPTKFGLMGGGVWEHASNQIILLDHTLRTKRKRDGKVIGEYSNILIDKNRHGLEPLEIPIYKDYETFRFQEYTPGDHDDDPFVSMDDDYDDDLPF